MTHWKIIKEIFLFLTEIKSILLTNVNVTCLRLECLKIIRANSEIGYKFGIALYFNKYAASWRKDFGHKKDFYKQALINLLKL